MTDISFLENGEDKWNENNKYYQLYLVYSVDCTVFLPVYLHCNRTHWRQKKETGHLRSKEASQICLYIAARNEQAVIGNLINSIKQQNYPAELIDVIVVADNCTDDTAQIARSMAQSAMNDLTICLSERDMP